MKLYSPPPHTLVLPSHKDDRMWYAYARRGVEDVVVFESLWTANAMIPIHALLSGFATTSKCLDLLARQRVMWSKHVFLPRRLVAKNFEA